MASGWIRTGLGGPNAPVSVEEAIPKVVDVLLAQQGKPGLQYLEREGARLRGETLLRAGSFADGAADHTEMTEVAT